MFTHRIGAELKDQAEKKVDQAKDKANELANDAKKKGEGKTREHQPIDRTKNSRRLEVKHDVLAANAGNVHHGSVTHDSHGQTKTTTTKVEVKTTSTGKPPLV